jgi:hypothetical protein
MPRILSRRTLANVALAAAVSAGSVAGVGLAQGGGAPATVSTPSPAAVLPGGILAGVHDVLAGLVASGTITQLQADAVQGQVDAGSIDPKQLVESGALSDAQMHAVADVIDQVKKASG